MSIKVLPSQQVIGLQTETQFSLAALLWITNTTLFPDISFSVAVIKTALDAGQPAPFATANFDQFLSNIYNLNLDTTLLTASERTRLNLIFEYLQPAPQNFCSGIATPSNLNTAIFTDKRIGSASFEYELQAIFDSVTSDVYQVEITLNPQGGAPAALVPTVLLFSKGCDNGFWIFTKLWVDFATTPVGVGYSYDMDLVVKDIDSNTLATYTILGVAFT